jgi:hypothetical protein
LALVVLDDNELRVLRFIDKVLVEIRVEVRVLPPLFVDGKLAVPRLGRISLA